MVWAQFELQAGIICASAPALRVFFRRYLGGGGGNNASRRSNNNNITPRSITVIRDTSVTFDKDGSVMRPSVSEKKQFHELRDVSTPIPEDGEEITSSRSRSAAEEPTTYYSHDEDSVGLSHVSQFPWSTPAGRSGGGEREKGMF
jgi:hypothetical protein